MQITLRSDNAFEIRSRDLNLELTPTSASIGDFIIPGPGEYEIGGVLVTANASSIRLEVEGIAIEVMKENNQLPKEAELEQLGAIDVLFFVLGGKGLAPKEATLLVAQLEAPLIIPMIIDQTTADQFCGKEVACENISGTYKLTRSQIPGEGSHVLLFNKG